MFLELIATIVAGFAAAGAVLLVNRVTGRRLPRWLMPVVAGLAMIGVTIANEQTWFSRTAGNLPEGMIVVEKVESRALYRPWTYLFPLVKRFAAVDGAAIKTHPGQPDWKLADVYFFGRWDPVRKLSVLADCKAHRRAALTGAAAFGADGTVTGVDWVTVSDTDPIVAAMCGGG